MFKSTKLRRDIFSTFKVCLVLLLLLVSSMSVSAADEVNVTAGGDDNSYLIANTSIVFQGVRYDSVYITNNSVITFGSGSWTYSDYPNLPSISFNSIDWVQYPSLRSDEHLVISTYTGGFEIDLAGRPYPNNPGGLPTDQLTKIFIRASIDSMGEASYVFSVTGPDYMRNLDEWNNLQRTGARTAANSAVITEGSTSWPNFRVTRIVNNALPLISEAYPEIQLSDGRLSCTPGKYRFGNGPNEDINSIAYTLFVNDKAMSRIAFDSEYGLNPSMFTPIEQSIPGIVTKAFATWDVTRLKDFTAKCEVTVVKSGKSFKTFSPELMDSARKASITVKEKAWDLERAAAVAANFSKEAREKRKRLASLANR